MDQNFALICVWQKLILIHVFSHRCGRRPPGSACVPWWATRGACGARRWRGTRWWAGARTARSRCGTARAAHACTRSTGTPPQSGACTSTKTSEWERVATGGHIGLQNTVCWHQIKCSATLLTSFSNAQLILKCKEKVSSTRWTTRPGR